MNKSIILAIVIASMVISACSKGDGDNPAPAPAPSLSDARNLEKVKKAVEEKKAADAPKADKSIPLEDYKKLDGISLMFVYIAMSNDIVDYENIASVVSKDFRIESDSFKKRDILNGLTPKIDESIGIMKRKESKYFITEYEADIGKYDFDAKFFPINNFLNKGDGYYQYFNDASNWHWSEANKGKFEKLPISDEIMARKIESMRSNGNRMKILVYMFASDVKLGEKTVNMEITYLKLMDNKGNVLAELK